MNRRSRLLIALAIFFSGMALVPQVNLFAGVVSWQRFAGGYEDVVTVTLVRYLDSAVEGGNLEVRATSTAGGSATLTVWRASDNMMIGTMTWNGTDHYGLFPITPNPENIIVRSSAGGESTVPVPEVPTAVTVSTLSAESDARPYLSALALVALAGLAVFIAARRR
jgi:hypothetical protein